jgi:hypothetical protein
MPLKTFAARNGTPWSVWRIESTTSRDVAGMPRAWLLFQDEEGTERRRLVDFPAAWETLSDERLEQLCRIATPARGWSRPSPPGGVASIDDPAGMVADNSQGRKPS